MRFVFQDGLEPDDVVPLTPGSFHEQDNAMKTCSTPGSSRGHYSSMLGAGARPAADVQVVRWSKVSNTTRCILDADGAGL